MTISGPVTQATPIPTDIDGGGTRDAAAKRLLARAEANLVAARRAGRERLRVAAD